MSEHALDPCGRCRLLLACGGVDSAVRLLVCPPGGTDFVQACKLVGHQDWVRSVALRHTAASGDTPGVPPASSSLEGGFCVVGTLDLV